MPWSSVSGRRRKKSGNASATSRTGPCSTIRTRSGKSGELLKLRAPFYRQADVLINTDQRSAREVAQQIVLQFKLATRPER